MERYSTQIIRPDQIDRIKSTAVAPEWVHEVPPNRVITGLTKLIFSVLLPLKIDPAHPEESRVSKKFSSNIKSASLRIIFIVLVL